MERYRVTTTYVKQLWLRLQDLRLQTYKSAEEREHLSNLQAEYRNLIDLLAERCLFQNKLPKSLLGERTKKQYWLASWKPTLVYQNKNK